MVVIMVMVMVMVVMAMMIMVVVVVVMGHTREDGRPSPAFQLGLRPLT
jgi:hypothetical protein